jgi:hypothetical protein
VDGPAPDRHHIEFARRRALSVLQKADRALVQQRDLPHPFTISIVEGLQHSPSFLEELHAFCVELPGFIGIAGLSRGHECPRHGERTL